jgi:carbon starvation protein
MYLALAVVMGLVNRFLKPPLWLSTLVFVPATLGAVWLSTKLSTVLVLDARTWAALILGYCFVGSLVPVWSLLQPRGYLGGFVLYLALGAGVAGTLFGGFEIKQEAFLGFQAPGPTGALFPFLFVTIACGACSGFHGLVCSGTTSKQIAKEPHCKSIGYGAMLLEAFVAVIALATVMIAAPAELKGMAPGAVYGQGLGRFMAVVIGEEHLAFAATFGAMAFSTFVFDTLDVCTRLGRYILQELFDWKGRAGAVVTTALMCVVPLGLVLLSGPGGYRSFWTLFGTSNQLLAGLSLVVVSVWLKRSGRRYFYALAPAIFVLAITLWSLVSQILSGTSAGATTAVRLNAGVSVVLLALAISVMLRAGQTIRQSATT